MKTAQQREELAALKIEAKKDKKSFNQLVSMAKRRGALVSVTIGSKTIIHSLTLFVILALFSCYSRVGPFSDIVTETAKDYQIECTMDSLIVYDYGRRVGAMAYDSSMISGIILQDNQ